MSLHKDLLLQARHLVVREPLRPKQASLRRAISTAYYALFHLLIDEATSRLIVGRDRDALRRALGRAFSHTGMKEAAQGFATGKVSPKLDAALGSVSLSLQIVSVANAFLDLQQARHEADYDTSRRFFRSDALSLVQQAEGAFADWQVVRKTVEADVFLVALLALRLMRT